MRTPLTLAALLLATSAGTAAAQPGVTGRAADGAPERHPFRDRRTAVTLQLGLGTPTGLAGVEVDRAIGGVAGLAVGAGFGAGATPQLSSMIRLRAPAERVTFGVGGGLSAGGLVLEHFQIFGSRTTRIDAALWGNGELFVERRSREGLILRTTFGVGKALASSGCSVTETTSGFFGPDETMTTPCSAKEAHPLVPSIGFSLGKAF